MMLGQMQVTGNMYQESADLVPDDRDLKQALAEAIERLPAGILTTAAATITPPPSANRRPSMTGKRPKRRACAKGHTLWARMTRFTAVKTALTWPCRLAATPKTAQKNVERVKGLTAIREAGRDLLDLTWPGRMTPTWKRAGSS